MTGPDPRLPDADGLDAEGQDPDRFTVKSEWTMVRVERRGWWRR